MELQVVVGFYLKFEVQASKWRQPSGHPHCLVLSVAARYSLLGWWPSFAPVAGCFLGLTAALVASHEPYSAARFG